MGSDSREHLSILAAVDFNGGEALVLNRHLEYLYHQVDSNTIVGRDGPFYDCYYYGAPSGRFKAFGGREFRLSMDDGSEVLCNGQWWSGVTEGAIKYLGGSSFEDIQHATVNSLKRLSECYVYFGAEAHVDTYRLFRASYTGPRYGYQEFNQRFILDVQKRYSDLYGDIRRDRDFRIHRFKKLVKRLKEANSEG